MAMNKKYSGLADKDSYDFKDLCSLIDALLAPDGCAWDRAQTHDSLKQNMIEETYEALEAIDMNDDGLLCVELGDVLLQVLLHSAISSAFSIGDVINALCNKIVARHRHVFGDQVAKTPDEAIISWEKAKRDENGGTGLTAALKRVPSNLPALMRAYKVSHKAIDAGYSSGDIGQSISKIEDALSAFRGGIDSGDSEKNEDNLGNLLLEIVNVACALKIQPELALTASIDDFIGHTIEEV
jgi:tetrapyrrole methylase family protein/MazG family protein